MQSDIREEIRDTELFMMAQFIDVINILESYENIEDIKNEQTIKYTWHIK